ncbi:MAG: hypothetical protein R3C05_26930 [Pirellulaceae bacterium]
MPTLQEESSGQAIAVPTISILQGDGTVTGKVIGADGKPISKGAIEASAGTSDQ